jgi:hypothetical protein
MVVPLAYVDAKTCQSAIVTTQRDYDQYVYNGTFNCTQFDSVTIVYSSINLRGIPITSIRSEAQNLVDVPRNISWPYLQSASLSGSLSDVIMNMFIANFSIVGTSLSISMPNNGVESTIQTLNIPPHMNLKSLTLIRLYTLKTLNLPVSATSQLSTLILQSVALQLTPSIAITTTVNCTIDINGLNDLTTLIIEGTTITSFDIMRSEKLQYISIHADRLGRFWCANQGTFMPSSPSHVIIDVVDVYGGVPITEGSLTKVAGFTLTGLMNGYLSFPRAITMITDLSLTRNQLLNITWPLWQQGGSIVIGFDTTLTSVIFPSTLVTMTGHINLQSLSGLTDRVHLGSLHTILALSINACESLQYLIAPLWRYSKSVGLGSLNSLRSIVTGSGLMVRSTLTLSTTGINELSFTDFQLRSVGELRITAGNITSFDSIEAVECSFAQVTMSSCCPELYKYHGGCLTSTSVDCHDCVTWTSISPSSGPISGGQVVKLTYDGIAKPSHVLLYLGDSVGVMTCNRQPNDRSFQCLTPVPQHAVPYANLTISLVNGRSAPILLPFQYQYLNWQDWAPVAAPSRRYLYQATSIPGLPSDRSSDTSELSNTIMISAAISFGVLLIIWGLSSIGCSARCRGIRYLDAFDTPSKIFDVKLKVFHYSYQQTTIGAFATLACVMVRHFLFFFHLL